MRAISGYVSVCSALLACGASSTSNSANVIFTVEPPSGDTSCIGVAGFEVTISSGSRSASSGPLLNTTGTVLASDACHLPHSFSLANLDLDLPASVTVAGHDGAGTVRVQSMGQIDNLHAMASPLQLMATATPPLPVIVVPRMSLLGIADLSQVTNLAITTMRGAKKIANVVPGDYFSVEPGAYGVSAGDLSPQGGDGLFIDVTLNSGAAMRTKATAMWTGTYYQAQ